MRYVDCASCCSFSGEKIPTHVHQLINPLYPSFLQTSHSAFILPRRIGQNSIPPAPQHLQLSLRAYSLQLVRSSLSTFSLSSGGRTRSLPLRFAQAPLLRQCSLPMCATVSFKMQKNEREMNQSKSLVAAKHHIKNFLEGEPAEAGSMTTLTTKPIADLFLDTTIMFGDLVGVTA